MSLATNLLSVLITVFGYYSPYYGNYIFATGIFALSGAFTNWIAIYMLFEKVPLLYGSGIIPNKFEEFKSSIKKMVVEQFFSQERVGSLIGASSENLNKAIKEKLDYNILFESIIESVMQSQIGGMLSMFGGKSALSSFREPMIKKCNDFIDNFLQNNSGDILKSELLSKDIENLIDARLNELTPQMVKEIIHDMINEHLGWLVVWGGVFGGVIGLISEFIKVTF